MRNALWIQLCMKKRSLGRVGERNANYKLPHATARRSLPLFILAAAVHTSQVHRRDILTSHQTQDHEICYKECCKVESMSDKESCSWQRLPTWVIMCRNLRVKLHSFTDPLERTYMMHWVGEIKINMFFNSVPILI